MVKCPNGKILRKGYTRKDGTYVSPSCVKDMGKPGKTKPSQKVLPRPTSGGLSQYGYEDIRHKTARQRHQSLTKAVQKDGYATIVRRLNLLANYNKNTTPSLHEIMRRDLAWMKKELYSKYSITANK